MDIMETRGRHSDRTAELARRWVDAWTRFDKGEIELILAPEVTIECNLGWPAERAALLDTMMRLSANLDTTMILSVTATDARAAVLSDCRVLDPSGGIRLAEFLDVRNERVVGIRRVFDLTAVDQLVPTLRAPHDLADPSGPR